MKIILRIWFYMLCFLDDFWPGWQMPAPPKEDFLTDESFRFWMTRENRQ